MLQEIPLSEITKSPTNPRAIRSKEADNELRENVARLGLLEPLIVRPLNGMFELVAGERRYDAATACAMDKVPCVVREMSDEEVLEVQLAENLRRENMHPLDEAEAYRRMRDDFNRDAVDIASKLGVNRKKIERRLQLCALSRSAKTAFTKGVIELGIAEAISRVPDERHQDAVIKLIEQTINNNGRVTVETVRAIIARDYMLDLSDAPFDTEDANLVSGCVACSECPKRSTNLKKLWDDIDEGDRCTDPACFKLKNEAAWSSRKLNAELEGKKIATAAVNKQIFGHGESVMGGYVGLDEKCRDDERQRTWRRVIGKMLDNAQIILARSPRGHAREVISTTIAFDLAREAGLAWAQRGEERAPTTPEQRAREAEKERFEIDARKRGAKAALISAREHGLDVRFLEFVGNHVLATINDRELREIYEPKGVLITGEGEGKESKLVAAHLKKIEVHARVAEILEMLVAIDGAAGEQDAIDIYDVDFAGIKKALRDEIKAAKKAAEST